MKFKAGRCNSVLSACCLLRSGVMSLTRENKKEKVRKPRTKITWKEVKRQKVLLFWAAIMVAYGVVFYYLPLAGWAMAFQDYKPCLLYTSTDTVEESAAMAVNNGCDLNCGSAFLHLKDAYDLSLIHI